MEFNIKDYTPKIPLPSHSRGRKGQIRTPLYDEIEMRVKLMSIREMLPIECRTLKQATSLKNCLNNRFRQWKGKRPIARMREHTVYVMYR